MDKPVINEHDASARGMVCVRLCAICRTLHPRVALYRLTWRRSDEQLAWNPPSTTVGRSVYVCQQGDCAAQASTHHAKKLAKALKRPIPRVMLDALSMLIKEASPSGPD